MIEVSKSEYDLLCKIYLDNKKEYKSYAKLARNIQKTSSNPIFQNVIKLLINKELIDDIGTNGKSIIFKLKRVKLFELIESTTIYKQTESIMHARDKFIITP